MSKDNQQANSDGQTESQTPLLQCRQDIQDGLRVVHEKLTATQEDSTTAASYIQALISLLADKGIVKPEELETLMRQVRWQMIREPMPRVRMGTTRDKYTAAGVVDVDCASLMPICKSRCCTFAFFLTKQDLDEGIVRWDYGNPYWIKQGADGHCTHRDPVTGFCTIHEHRPYICRKFDCHNDERLWLDFDAKIPAAPLEAPGDDPVALAELLLHQAPPRMDREDS